MPRRPCPSERPGELRSARARRPRSARYRRCDWRSAGPGVPELAVPASCVAVRDDRSLSNCQASGCVERAGAVGNDACGDADPASRRRRKRGALVFWSGRLLIPRWPLRLPAQAASILGWLGQQPIRDRGCRRAGRSTTCWCTARTQLSPRARGGRRKLRPARIIRQRRGRRPVPRSPDWLTATTPPRCGWSTRTDRVPRPAASRDSQPAHECRAASSAGVPPVHGGGTGAGAWLMSRGSGGVTRVAREAASRLLPMPNTDCWRHGQRAFAGHAGCPPACSCTQQQHAGPRPRRACGSAVGAAAPHWSTVGVTRYRWTRIVLPSARPNAGAPTVAVVRWTRAAARRRRTLLAERHR